MLTEVPIQVSWSFSYRLLSSDCFATSGVTPCWHFEVMQVSHFTLVNFSYIFYSVNREKLTL